jgi:hypothetical protein
LFHTMAIVSLNMGNLNLEVNSLRNRLGHRWEGEGNTIGGIRQGKGLLEGVQT